MVSKTLARLVDQAIVPAVFLVAGKIIGVFVVSRYFNLTWELSTSGILFFPIKEDALLVNSYSSVIMFAFAWFGFCSILVSSHFLHDTHIRPKFAARLSSLNLLHLVESTYELYTKAVVWLAYLWLMSAIFLIQSYFGSLFSWVGGISIILTIVVTAVFIFDLEREIHNSSKEERRNSLDTSNCGGNTRRDLFF